MGGCGNRGTISRQRVNADETGGLRLSEVSIGPARNIVGFPADDGALVPQPVVKAAQAMKSRFGSGVA